MIKRCLGFILIGWLSSCTSIMIAQELEQGKISFSAGNFKQAFHQLLPLAAKGEAQAQYAVGYMYYYGYGAAQDKESGLFWMQKSAEQQYAPALKALAIIHSHQNEPERPVTRQAWKDEKTVTSALIKNPSPKTFPSPQPCKAMWEKSFLSTYALQLFGSYDLATLKEVQTRLHLEKMTQYWRTQHNGRDWYVLTYQQYATLQQAKNALSYLPHKVKSLKPWIRKVAGLEKKVYSVPCQRSDSSLRPAPHRGDMPIQSVRMTKRDEPCSTPTAASIAREGIMDVCIKPTVNPVSV